MPSLDESDALSGPFESAAAAPLADALPRRIAGARARPKFEVTRKRPWGRIATGLVALVLAAAGAGFKLRAVPVTVTPVVRGTAVDAVYATGTVEPLERVVVKSRAVGPIDLKVREGARVHKGDLLAVIDSPALKHDLARGRADLWAASHQAGRKGPQLSMLQAQARSLDADLNTIRGERTRVESLVASGSSPQAELDRLVDRSAALEAQLAANTAQQESLDIDLTARALGSSAAVDSLAARLSDTEVRAPMDGVVLARFVEPGEVAMLNSPLLKLGSSDDLILECAIDEADIGRVTPGKSVAISLYAFAQTVYKGEVFEILPDADREKKTFLTKVKILQPPAGLRSGMTAEANVILEEKPGVLLLPADSIDARGDLFVVAGDRVERRTPHLGIHDMLRVEVQDGLAEGDQVVVAGAESLADGARVRATVRPPATTAARPSSVRAGMSM